MMALVFVVFAVSQFAHTGAVAQNTVRAWKDDSSFGLENEHLLVTGAKVAYIYDWGWNSVTFKDTGTVWKLPWNELSAGATIGLGINGKDAESHSIQAVTEPDKAYINYEVVADDLKWDQTYTILPGEPYIREEVIITSLTSANKSFELVAGYISYIAGDLDNDHYFIPSFLEGNFVGNSQDRVYSPADEGWIALWDSTRKEGVGIVIPDKVLSYRTYDWFGVCLCGEGATMTLERIQLAPFAMTRSYEMYLYFYVGIGSSKVKEFYDAVRKLPYITPISFPKMILGLLSGTEGQLRVGEERQLRLEIANLENRTLTYRVEVVSDAVEFLGSDEVVVRIEPFSSKYVAFGYVARESGMKTLVVLVYRDSNIVSQSAFPLSVSPVPSFWEVQPPWYVYLLISATLGAIFGYLFKEVVDRARRKSR